LGHTQAELSSQPANVSAALPSAGVTGVQVTLFPEIPAGLGHPAEEIMVLSASLPAVKNWSVPPKTDPLESQTPAPQTVTLFGNRVFTKVITLG
jgi:hypothetical protein